MQAGFHPCKSKVGTATMGEAKSVRVMGHRHAISKPLHPVRDSNFQLRPEPSAHPLNPAPSSHRCASSPRYRVLRCDLSALIIRQQESG